MLTVAQMFDPYKLEQQQQIYGRGIHVGQQDCHWLKYIYYVDDLAEIKLHVW